MPHNRFYSPETFALDQETTLEGKEHHHIKNVMRLTLNDSIELVNGKGDLARGKITKIGKQETIVTAFSVEHEKKKDFQLVLAQAMPQPSHLDMILEKGCELGVDEFWIFKSKFSSPLFKEEKRERYHQILISAMKQCGRLYLPTVRSFQKMEHLPTEIPVRFLADTEKTASFLKASTASSTLLIVGPESGFSKEEVDWFKDVYCAKSVKLSNQILRVETAAIAGISILQALMGV